MHVTISFVLELQKENLIKFTSRHENVTIENIIIISQL